MYITPGMETSKTVQNDQVSGSLHGRNDWYIQSSRNNRRKSTNPFRLHDHDTWYYSHLETRNVKADDVIEEIVIVSTSLRNQGSQVRWISAHKGVQGNERADRAANNDTNIE